MRAPLVSLSVKSKVGAPDGPASAANLYRPSDSCSAPTPRGSRPIRGFDHDPSCVAPHAHVLRYHSVGITWRGAGWSPRLAIRTRTRMSSDDAFAYSTNTSK